MSEYFQLGSKRFIPSTNDGFVTVAWDDQVPDWNYRSRTLSSGYSYASNAPAVFRFYPIAKDGIGDFRVNLLLPYDWEVPIIDLNNGNRKAFDYLTGAARAQYNTTGWPMQAYLVMSGNKLEGEFIGDFFRFKTLLQSDVNKVHGWTIDTHPQYVHRFTCITWDGVNKRTKRIPSTGTPLGQVYYYVVSKEGYGYIPKRHVIQH